MTRSMKLPFIRSILVCGAFFLAGCGTPSFFTVQVPQAVKEVTVAKQAADAGSTKGVAYAVVSSETISNGVASAKADPSAGSAAGNALINAGKVVSSPEVGLVVKAGVQGGATAAGMDDPEKTGVLADAARVGLGGLLVAAGAALNAWANRKKQTPTTPAG